MARKRMLTGKSTKYAKKSKSVTTYRPKMSLSYYGSLYDKEYKFTRDLSLSLVYTPGGFVDALAVPYPALSLTFGNASLTYYFNSTNSINVPLPNYTEIAALWDVIRIDKVELSFYNNHGRGATAYNQFFGTVPILIANDINSANLGTSITEIHQMRNKLLEPDRRIEKWTVYPKFQTQVFVDGTALTYRPASGFINTDTDTPHYGTKLAWLEDAGTLTSLPEGVMHVNVKYFFTAKNIK